MRFLIAELKTGRFVTKDGRHTTVRQGAISFDTEDKALGFCKKCGLLSTHVPVPVLKRQIPPGS